jgi:hypothetical protein
MLPGMTSISREELMANVQLSMIPKLAATALISAIYFGVDIG